jgi:hypothetical protein
MHVIIAVMPIYPAICPALKSPLSVLNLLSRSSGFVLLIFFFLLFECVSLWADFDATEVAEPLSAGSHVEL